MADRTSGRGDRHRSGRAASPAVHRRPQQDSGHHERRYRQSRPDFPYWGRRGYQHLRTIHRHAFCCGARRHTARLSRGFPRQFQRGGNREDGIWRAKHGARSQDPPTIHRYVRLHSGSRADNGTAASAADPGFGNVSIAGLRPLTQNRNGKEGRMSLGTRVRVSAVVASYFVAMFCGHLLLGAKPKTEPQQAAVLDFETYRTRIEPIFLKQRESGPRCYDCHSAMSTRLRLEPLPEGKLTWTEEQSRRNFEAVQQLIAPGEPLKSRLLLHPLAAEAGGDPAHGGGKFWKSQSDPEWQMLAEWVRHATAAPAAAQTGTNSQPKGGLDFDSFMAAVQPVFLKERPGHARCYGCHTAANRTFHLATLSPGLSDWTEEQSRQNFESASQLVDPGKPQSSRLLTHPLAPEAGGDAFHWGVNLPRKQIPI